MNIFQENMKKKENKCNAEKSEWNYLFGPKL